MNNRVMKRKTFWLIFVLMAISVGAQTSPPMIPYPMSLERNMDEIALTSDNKIVFRDDSLAAMADLFQEELMLVHGLDLAVTSGTQVMGSDILLALNPTLNQAEQYRLTVNDSIKIEASDIRGLYAGTVSLLQAIRQVGDARLITQMTVEDAPYRNFRGVMVDIKNQWHSVEDIKTIIRMCRFYKINYCSLHTGEEQWIGALLDQTAGFPKQTRIHNRLYTKAEMDEIIAFARSQGVYLLPHNESTRGFQGMQRAVSHDLYTGDAYANFIDEFDGQGAYTGNFNDTRYWNFIKAMTYRAIDQFKAGYPQGQLPYYHIGPVQGEGGMDRHDAARIVGYIRAKDPSIKTMFWNGIDGIVNDALAKLKSSIVVVYYQQWGGSDIQGYLSSGWDVLNAAWSPLYIVGSGLARSQEQVFNDWNTFRTGSDGFTSGGFEYEAIRWVNFGGGRVSHAVIGGMLCTWEVPQKLHMSKLRPRVSAFAEHAWHHKDWPYPAEDYSDFMQRFTQTDHYLVNFLMHPVPPSRPKNLAATDAVFEDKILVAWSASDNNPTGYDVYRHTVNNAGAANLIATVSQADYTDTDVTSGTTYYYWVKAFNVFGETELSASDAGTVGTSNLPAVAYEPFDYTVGKSINGQAGGTGWRGPWQQTSVNGVCRMNAYGLQYPGLEVSGQSLRLNPHQDTPSILVNRQLLGDMGIHGTSTWMSFLLKCHERVNGHLFVGFSGINVGKRWLSSLAIENNSSTTNVKNGETYLIVCQVVNRPGEDDVYLWINPPLGAQPTPALADLMVNMDMSQEGNVVINNQGYGQGRYDIDEIRTGYNWSHVIPESLLVDQNMGGGK